MGKAQKSPGVTGADCDVCRGLLLTNVRLEATDFRGRDEVARHIFAGLIDPASCDMLNLRAFLDNDRVGFGGGVADILRSDELDTQILRTMNDADDLADAFDSLLDSSCDVRSR